MKAKIKAWERNQMFTESQGNLPEMWELDYTYKMGQLVYVRSVQIQVIKHCTNIICGAVD